MAVDLRELAFGVEIEFTGMTRKRAAEICAAYFGTEVRQETQQKFSVSDERGRNWSFVYDSSIRAVPGGQEYQVELVSPICRYEDIERIQELVRKLRNEGHMKINRSCGLHIHVDGAQFDARTLRNLVNLVANKEDMIYRALNVEAGREMRYCKKTDPQFLRELNEKKPKDLQTFRQIWYQDSRQNMTHGHYDSSRYRCLNLHSFFEKGTVEYRVFNGTSHAGRIKAAIQFVLAITAQALNQKYVQLGKTQSDNEKYTFRTWLLRLGLIGDEFKTARNFLLKNLEGNSAWRDPAQEAAQRERLRQAAVTEADLHSVEMRME